MPSSQDASAPQENLSSPELLFPQVYTELEKVARAELSRHRRGATLNTGALVHETYIKLFAKQAPSFERRKHFFAAAALAMRHIIIDYARSRSAQRRAEPVDAGGQAERPADAVADQAAELVGIAECLEKLERIDPRARQVLELRFFAGLELPDIAEILNVSEKTVQRDTRFAQAFLQRELGHSPGAPS